MRAFPRLLLATAAMTALVLARPVLAGTTVDDDGDGVADDVDACLDTPAGDLVKADGCSVCPCDGPTEDQPWASRGEYQTCVFTEVRARKRAGSMNRKAARAAMKNARKASCGDAQLTRCCVYPSDIPDDADTIVGDCKVMTVDHCAQLEDTLDWAEDADPGSCLPNPCVF